MLWVAIGLIVSCTNVKESKEYKALEAQRDSLMMVTVDAESEAIEMMSVISEVEANFERIREAEKYISTQSAKEGEMSQDTRTRVTENFKMINDILQRNKTQLQELNRKYSGSTKEVASLKNTITRLNREMEESAGRLAEMQKELAAKDEKIAQLSQDITSLAIEAEQQSATPRASQFKHGLLRFDAEGVEGPENSVGRLLSHRYCKILSTRGF